MITEEKSARHSKSPDPDEWSLVIRPQRNLFDLRLGELWQYRDLIALFVRRDFVSVYKQTILGPLWYLIQPLLTTIIFTVIFGRIANLPTDGLPQFLFYMSGTVVWSLLCRLPDQDLQHLRHQRPPVRQGLFPAPGGAGLDPDLEPDHLRRSSSCFSWLLCSIIWLNGAAIQPNCGCCFTPLLLLMMAGLGLGFGIIVSSLTTRYRDLRFLVTFGVQLWMYATPVIYPVSRSRNASSG